MRKITILITLFLVAAIVIPANVNAQTTLTEPELIPLQYRLNNGEYSPFGDNATFSGNECLEIRMNNELQFHWMHQFNVTRIAYQSIQVWENGDLKFENNGTGFQYMWLYKHNNTNMLQIRIRVEAMCYNSTTMTLAEGTESGFLVINDITMNFVYVEPVNLGLFLGIGLIAVIGGVISGLAYRKMK